MSESVPLPQPINYGTDAGAGSGPSHEGHDVEPLNAGAGILTGPAGASPVVQPNAANSPLDSAAPGATPGPANYTNPDGHGLAGAPAEHTPTSNSSGVMLDPQSGTGANK